MGGRSSAADVVRHRQVVGCVTHELRQRRLERSAGRRPGAGGRARSARSRPPSGRGGGRRGAGAAARRGRPGPWRRARPVPARRSAARSRRRSRWRTAAARAAARRAAYSPASGCTKPASWGQCRLSSGRATSSVTRPPPPGARPQPSASGRSYIALTNCDGRVGEQRAEQPGDEAGVEGEQVGVDEDDDVAGRRGERPPQRLALAGDRGDVGQHVVPVRRRARRRPRATRGGGVGRPGVEDDELVDQRLGDVDQVATDCGDDRPRPSTPRRARAGRR